MSTDLAPLRTLVFSQHFSADYACARSSHVREISIKLTCGAAFWGKCQSLPKSKSFGFSALLGQHANSEPEDLSSLHSTGFESSCVILERPVLSTCFDLCSKFPCISMLSTKRRHSVQLMPLGTFWDSGQADARLWMVAVSIVRYRIHELTRMPSDAFQAKHSVAGAISFRITCPPSRS